MFYRLIFIYFLISLSCFAFLRPDEMKKGSKPSGKIFIGGKHIVLMNSNAEEIFATHYFGVFNETQEAQKITIPLWVPKETTDFEPQGGFTKEEIQLGEDGKLFLRKEFKKA